MNTQTLGTTNSRRFCTRFNELDVWCLCPEDECTFALVDNDLLHLLLALPQPESPMLGHQCDKSTRKTTFRSLLFLEDGRQEIRENLAKSLGSVEEVGKGLC